jgi:1,4-alpha-glucan branching enzyme
VGTAFPGFWKELLNSDARIYGGSGMGNCGGFNADHVPYQGKPYSLNLTLPPLSILFFEGGQG